MTKFKDRNNQKHKNTNNKNKNRNKNKNKKINKSKAIISNLGNKTENSTFSNSEITGKKEVKGYIFSIQKLSTEDGIGIRTTVFFKGCPLRCVWCHNPESIEIKPSIVWYDKKCIGCKSCIEACPNNAISFNNGIHINRNLCKACGTCVEVCPATALKKFGEYWTVEDLVKEVLKDKMYYIKSNGGITASGGEAALQTEFLVEFFKRLKEEGIHIALDTCGAIPREKFKALIPFVDLYLYDIKEIDPQKHKDFTGMDNKLILENLKWLVGVINNIHNVNTNIQIWIRTPIIPDYTATEENIRGIGNFIVNELKNQIDRWDLLAFNNLSLSKYKQLDIDWKLKDKKLLTEEDMNYFYHIAISTGVNNVQWSGMTRQKSKDNVSSAELNSINKKTRKTSFNITEEFLKKRVC
ncbi:MAG: glycyl-radical enzyme activating protein [Candidatus Helarchaeota archaeon]